MSFALLSFIRLSATKSLNNQTCITIATPINSNTDGRCQGLHHYLCMIRLDRFCGSKCACKEDYTWNPRTYAWECDKDCEIDVYLKNCSSMKSLIDDLVITCDEVVVTIWLWLWIIIAINCYYIKHWKK